MWHTLLHQLEFTNALAMKVFFKTATDTQVNAARGLVASDLKAGVLVSAASDERDVFFEAVNLAEQYTPVIGCRSLDILHCAAAKILGTSEFITSDARQQKLASAIGLNLIAV
jgi:hypothetical protein